jgi:hypothetical protein
LIQLVGYIPRQQLVDAIDRMIGDALKCAFRAMTDRIPG